MNARIHPDAPPRPMSRTEDDFSLPGWIYWDPEFFELERTDDFQEVLAPRLPRQRRAGGGRLPDVRVHQRVDPDRARHGWAGAQLPQRLPPPRLAARGRRDTATAAQRITCPYHAWTYSTDGRLVGVPMRANYPGMDTEAVRPRAARAGDLARFRVRALRAGPAVGCRPDVAPYADELAEVPLEDLKPLGPARVQTRTVNWKNVSDNYSDGLHIPVAHPGLTRIFGKGYSVEAKEWVDKMSGEFVDIAVAARCPSACTRSFMTQLAPRAGGEAHMWNYYKLWPNVAIELYLDQIDFMQFVPVSPTETVLRYINYALPDGRREMRAARYLNWRINRLVNLEDKVADRARAGGHGLFQLHGRPARRGRGVPAELRPPHARAVSGMRARASRRQGLEHQPQGAAAAVSARAPQAALRAPGRERPARGTHRGGDREPEAPRPRRPVGAAYRGRGRRLDRPDQSPLPEQGHAGRRELPHVQPAPERRASRRRWSRRVPSRVLGCAPSSRLCSRARTSTPQVLTAWVVYWALLQTLAGNACHPRRGRSRLRRPARHATERSREGVRPPALRHAPRRRSDSPRCSTVSGWNGAWIPRASGRRKPRPSAKSGSTS